MPKSLVSHDKEFSDSSWIVSHCSQGGGGGHSVITVEGIRQNAQGQDESFLTQYHIRTDPLHAIEDQHYYFVAINDWAYDASETEFPPLAADPTATNLVLRAGLIEYYKNTYHRSKAKTPAEVQEMVDRIQLEKRQNEAFHEQRQHITDCIMQAGEEALTSLPDEHELKRRWHRFQQQPALFDRHIRSIYYSLGAEAMKSQPTEAYTTQKAHLQRWVDDNNYEPRYRMMVVSAIRAIDRSTNCATWCTRYLYPLGLATSLPASSGGSHPNTVARWWAGMDSAPYVAAAAAATAVGLYARSRGVTASDVVSGFKSIAKFAMRS